MNDSKIHAGTPLDALETPAALVDLDRLVANIARMAAYAKQHDLALRPHIKTHKATTIAASQIAHGAAGLTCATPAEVGVMSAVSDDILLAYPAIGPKLARLMALPRDLGLHPETNKKVIANIGRFGPYVNHEGKFKSIPRSDSIFDIDLARAVELLAQANSGPAPIRELGSHQQKAALLRFTRVATGFMFSTATCEPRCKKASNLKPYHWKKRWNY